MRKVLKGSRLRLNDLLDKIINEEYDQEKYITINGCIYELVNGSLILIGEEKEKEKDEPI